jgi:hypothetical protein
MIKIIQGNYPAEEQVVIKPQMLIHLSKEDMMDKLHRRISAERLKEVTFCDETMTVTVVTTNQGGRIDRLQRFSRYIVRNHEYKLIAHHPTLPARVSYFTEGDFPYVGTPRCIEYMQCNVQHRLDGPAVQRFGTSYDDDKQVYLYSEQWYDNGVLHRLDGKPAEIHYFPSGSPRSFEWYENSNPLSINGAPTDMYFEESGLIEQASWYDENCQLHRDGGLPARIVFDADIEDLVTKIYAYRGDDVEKSDLPDGWDDMDLETRSFTWEMVCG